MTAPLARVCWVSAPRARARPKSATLTSPEAEIRTFSGLMSRCTMPWACAAESACSTCSSSASERAGDIGACSRISSRKVVPRTCSMTMKSRPWSSPWSVTATTLGWEIRAALRASRTNLLAKSLSSPRSSCITLTAMSRARRRSWAS